MKNQMKFQKIIVKTFVIFAAISVFYSLIFATPFYQLTIIDGQGIYNLDGSSVADLYEAVQPFNKMFFYLCLAYLLFSLLLFVFFTQSRRLYYVSNYIVSFANALFGVVISAVALINIISFRAEFTAIDFDYIIPAMLEASGTAVSGSTWSFDLGIIVYACIILLSGCLVANAIWKMKAMKQDKKEFGEIDAQIRQSWAEHQQKLLEEAGLDES